MRTDVALRSAEKFVSLINDYLDYAKIDAGYLRLERVECDLAEIIHSSADQAVTQAELKHQRIDVSVSANLPAFVDARKLEQVLDNLISNAIKYTPDGGTITITAESAGDRATVRVADTGQGITPAQLGQLFSKYHRVPGQETAKIQGTGLGLLITKEIVEAHGGTARAESSGIAGEGSVFIVELPLRPAPTGDRAP